jgi:hypothetical protein
MKDKTSEGQHHGIEKITLKGNCYYVGVGDIGEERCSGRDARTVWVEKQKVSGGSGGGGPHQRLSHRTWGSFSVRRPGSGMGSSTLKT